MWYELKDKLPVDGTKYPVWVVANHSGYEFHEYALWSSNTWWVGGYSLERMGWTFVAWFDLPKYR